MSALEQLAQAVLEGRVSLWITDFQGVNGRANARIDITVDPPQMAGESSAVDR